MKFRSAALQQRMDRADPSVRQMIEAHVFTAASLKQTKTDFTAADSLTGLDVLDEGAVRLEDSITTLLTSTVNTAYASDLDRTFPIFAARIVWGGTEPNDIEIKRISLGLNPRVDTGQLRQVAVWRLELFQELANFSGIKIHPADQLVLAPLCAPLDVAVTGDAFGAVTFDYSTAAVISRPKPKIVQTKTAGPVSIRVVPVTYLILTALKADGTPAGNVGWAYDSGTASVNSGGNVLSSVSLIAPFAPALDVTHATHEDDGSGGGAPYCTIDQGTYTDATISFTSGNLLDLGAAPAGDVQLSLQGNVPPGCALTGRIRNDADSGWVTFVDGDFMGTDLGLTPSTTRKVQVALATDTSGALTPTLRLVGMSEVAITDLSDVAELVFIGGYGFDPKTLVSEIPRATLRAVRDGDRDYQDAITTLLATTDIGSLFFRVFVGADDLPRGDWMHQDDWYVVDSTPRGPDLQLLVMPCSVFLRDQVPGYEPGASYAPDGDQSAGAWTTAGGSGSNLYQQVDETTADDSDYIRSELDPAGSAVVLTLPTPTDATGRKHFVEYHYRKDTAAGKTIDLLVELLQTTTVISSFTHTDIPATVTSGAFTLTDAQVASITDYPNLRLRFTATVGGAGGSRRAIVTWCRFRLGGKRETVAYANQSRKAVYDDLLANQLGLPTRFRGPGIEDTTTLVGKTLTQPGPLQPTAKAEVDNLLFLGGQTHITSQGRLKVVDVFGPGAIVDTLPAEEIHFPAVSPGYEQRIPEYFVGWGWDPARREFTDEVRSFHGPSLTALGNATRPELSRCPQEIAEWIEDQALAETIGRRMVEAIGPGLMRWAGQGTYVKPWWEPGDRVLLEVEPFVAKDPNAARELRGRLWVIGRVMLLEDFWGTRVTFWIQSYADILSTSEAAVRIGREPNVGVRFVSLPGAPQSLLVSIKSHVEGATIYYLYLDAATAVPEQLPASAWLVYSGTLILQRDESADKKLALWADDHGVRSRTVAYTIEHDHTPAITGLTLTQRGAPSSAVDASVAVDTDVREIAWYRRDNAAAGFYPTTGSHGATDPLDPTYLTKRVPITADGVGRYQDGTPAQGGLTDDGVTTLGGAAPTYASSQYVIVIAVPYDNEGNVGARINQTLQIGGGATPQISTVTASVTDNGSDCSPNDAEVTVAWTVSGVVDGTHDLEVWREIVGLLPAVMLTREASPASNLSYVDQIGEFVSTGPVQTYRYVLKVVPNGGGTALDTKQFDLAVQVSGTCPL